MPDKSILGRVVTVLADTFSVISGELGADTVAADVDGWDSVSHAMLVMNLEDEFSIELPIEATMAAENVGEMARLIERHLPA